MELARAVGFSTVQRYQGLSRAEILLNRTPLLYFLCSPVDDVRRLKPMADAIRFSPSFKMRFLPLIYFAREPSIDTVKHCIEMGFDDVIALPFAGDDIGDRLARQIGTVQSFYATATYFGPDRRNRMGAPARSPDSDRGGGEHRRIEIRRNTDTGVDILSEHLHL
jgi:hypothetical protein